MTEAKVVIDGKEIRYSAEDDGRELIDSADQIPPFAGEAEEQLWWRTRAFSERFWREAKPVPPQKLPPLRSEDEPAGPDAGSPAAGSRAALSGGWVAGMLVGGHLIAGAGYLLYELLKGRSATGSVLPTRVPYLPVSAMQPVSHAADLEALLRQLPARAH
jgi:hypothetical protein